MKNNHDKSWPFSDGEVVIFSTFNNNEINTQIRMFSNMAGDDVAT